VIWRTLLSIGLGLTLSAGASAKDVMTPEKLWQVKRVSGLGLNKDQTHVIYKVTQPSVEGNDFSSKVYQVPVAVVRLNFLKHIKAFCSMTAFRQTAKRSCFMNLLPWKAS